MTLAPAGSVAQGGGVAPGYGVARGGEVVSGDGAAQALFREARLRRRRRRLTGLAVIVLAAAATTSALTWLPGTAGGGIGRGGPSAAGHPDNALAAVAWIDNVGNLRVGRVGPRGVVNSRVAAEVYSAPLPLVAVGNRVYWVDPAGTFVPALGHWAQVVRYLNLDTGRIGTAGPGQTAFLSADRRDLFMSQPLHGVTEMPVAGGAARQLSLPAGWYLPGGNGLPDLVSGQGLATAAGILVQSRQSPGAGSAVLGLWSPGGRSVTVIGRSRGVIDAYTPPGAHYSLVAWLPVACRPPGSCLIKITNTATRSVSTVRCPLSGGFALGGAFSPRGNELAVFATTRSRTSARLALINIATGAIRVAPRPELPLGMDIGWARWLPGGVRLIAGTSTSYLIDSVTLAVRPLASASAGGRARAGGHQVNYTAAVVQRPR